MESSNKGIYDILIVEDSATQAKQLEIQLREQGFMVTVAANGREGIAEAKRSKPNLIISDIQMPEMNGYEMCRLIKQEPGLKEIPIILLTTLTDPSDVIEALNVNADSYVSKPYDEKYLLAKINQLILAPAGDKNDRPGEILKIDFAGKNVAVTSNRSQILTLLISMYEDMVMKNHELITIKEVLEDVNEELGNKLHELQATKEELRKSYEELEMKVKMRTADLKKANTELLEQIRVREKAESALQETNEEIKTVSQQLMQAEKLATLGELASSIAHELNNPLTTVTLSVEMLISQTNEDDPRRRKLEIIGHEVERMGNLVSNLLQFSRRSQPQISTVNVCDEIEKTLELIIYQLRKRNIAVEPKFEPGATTIHADRQQLRQLFLNLFMNASDAMPEGGKLTIRVFKQGSGVRDQVSGIGDQGSEVGDQGSEIRGQGSEVGDQGSGVRDRGSGATQTPDPRSPAPDHKGKAFVVIEIADTGVGIPPEILSKVMEPFYTTKPEGKGTGLGLSICRRIVEGHGGTLGITSEGCPGKGTRVCINLPSSNGHNTASL
ncbi:MAG: response regulator [Pseudomonadota bacterium]